MKKSECKIGQRVRVIDSFCGIKLVGREGTIVAVDQACYEIGVEFDEPFPSGHDCQGRAKRGCGRYGNACEVELIEEIPIKIDFSFGDLMQF